MSARQVPHIASLIAAVRAGDSRAVEEILLQGADPDACERNVPVLIIAAFGGHLPVVRCLIAARATLETYDPSFATALHTAVAKKNFRIAEALLDAGADINAQRNPGFSSTPLHSAICLDMHDGESERTAFLLHRGADVGRRAYIGMGKISDTGDALAHAMAMPDGRAAHLAELIATWRTAGERQRRLNEMARSGKNRLKL